MSKDVIETAVRIMDRTFQVKCSPSDVPALEQAAKYLQDKLHATRKVSQSIGFERIAIITALNITHELLSNERNKSQVSGVVNQKLYDLNGKLDEALARCSQMGLEPAE